MVCCSFLFGCFGGGGATHDAKSTTLVTSRSCTDKLILLLFIAAAALSIAVVSTASGLGGDPRKIINGVDYLGRICGHTAEVSNKPLAALVNPLSLDLDTLSVWTCLKTCNETKDASNPSLAALYGSTEFFGKYCIPTFDLEIAGGVDLRVQTQFDSSFTNVGAEVSRAVSDVANSWGVMLLSIGIALVSSYLYIWLTKRFAGVLIWLCILLVILGGFFIGYSFLQAAADASVGTSAMHIQAYEVTGYIFIAATSLFVLVILGLSSRINVAIEVVKEGSKAINDMKAIMFFPLVPLAMVCAYLVYSCVGFLYIFSVSELQEQTTPSAARIYGPFHPNYSGDDAAPAYNSIPSTYQEFVIGDSYRPLAAIHTFHLLWMVQFGIYFGYTVIAGAVCSWYFTLSDEQGNKKVGGKDGGSHTPLLQSLWRTVRYHVGSVAFAALIIAIIQFIRVAVKYIEKKTRSDPPNHLQRAVFCVINCCLKCAECCMDKVSKNALVWVSMWGDPFLPACCSSFALIWKNLARVAAVHVVGDVILLIGQVAITILTVGLSALLLMRAEPWKSTVSSVFVPCILIALLSFAVARVFFLTFETVIDTTFLCFLVDCENAEKSGEAMFASKGLQKLVGKYQLRSAMEAENAKKEAADLYKQVGGEAGAAKVADEHSQAVAQLSRAVTMHKAQTGNQNAVFPFSPMEVESKPTGSSHAPKLGWQEK